MQRSKTWKIIKWHRRPAKIGELELCCPGCHHDALLPVSREVEARAIAAMGLRLVFDPPDFQPAPNDMPGEIQCRKCLRIFSEDEGPAAVAAAKPVRHQEARA
jgi:uncharacterized protein YbaR (Trm112 family)